MKVLAAQSKPSAVRKHYDSMRDLLKDELGVELFVRRGKRQVLMLKYLLRNPALDVKVIRLVRDGEEVELKVPLRQGQ